MPVPCCPIIKHPPIAAFDDPAAAADQPQIRQRQHDQQPRQPLPILEPGLIEVQAPALPVAKYRFNGIVASDKFCMSRMLTLDLTWRRGPSPAHPVR